MTVNETQWKVENECEITWKQFLMWDLRRAHGLKLKTSQANWQNATRDAKSRSRRRGRGSAMEWGVCWWLPQLQLQLKLASFYLDSAAGLSSKTHELTLCVRVCECVCACVWRAGRVVTGMDAFCCWSMLEGKVTKITQSCSWSTRITKGFVSNEIDNKPQCHLHIHTHTPHTHTHTDSVWGVAFLFVCCVLCFHTYSNCVGSLDLFVHRGTQAKHLLQVSKQLLK